MLFRNSTLSGNYALDDGGAIYLYQVYDGDLELRNSTVSNNRAQDEGGGIHRTDPSDPADSPLLSSSIIANNLPDGLSEQEMLRARSEPSSR